MFVVVHSKEDKRHLDHSIKVREWNETTKQWETIWSMIRSQPFTAQIEVEDTLQYADTVYTKDFEGVAIQVSADALTVEDKNGVNHKVTYDEVRDYNP